ncbi:hypothetical protein H3Z83_09505 [Tenacibaculum sp. S7007]|uniref:Uncharacterized protein n=1 Tax=Tenacibaculum pelagium TaxID=2759527 RepID=A0A839AR66_9FLAO|nr:hypothetical protein [Tenacibaculum pelagium]MBA6156749.1 hypothetical protein [Tenacibaculum pelagium]
MGINIGGVDIAQSALDSEYRILILEELVEKLINKMGGQNLLSSAELEKIRENSLKKLQAKYPNAGLEKK